MVVRFWRVVVLKTAPVWLFLNSKIKLTSEVVRLLAFPRKLRLLTPSCFALVFQQSRRVSTSQITIFGRLNSLGYPRIGLSVARKNVKYAHERNRIKRLTRESFRLRQHELPSMDFVVVAKKGIADLSNCALSETLKKLWDRYCYPVRYP